MSKNEDIAAHYGVRNIPTIVMLKGGEMVDVGAATKDALKAKIDAFVERDFVTVRLPCRWRYQQAGFTSLRRLSCFVVTINIGRVLKNFQPHPIFIRTTSCSDNSEMYILSPHSSLLFHPFPHPHFSRNVGSAYYRYLKLSNSTS